MIICWQLHPGDHTPAPHHCYGHRLNLHGTGWPGLGWAGQGKWNVWLRVGGGGGWGWLCNLWFRYFPDMVFYWVHLYFSQYKAKCMGEAPLPALSAYFRIWAFYADLWFCEHFRLSLFRLFLGAAGHHIRGTAGHQILADICIFLFLSQKRLCL